MHLVVCGGDEFLMSPGPSIGRTRIPRLGACPACRGTALRTVLEWPELPVNSTLFLATREEAVAVARASFRLTVCRECGFAFNADFDPTLPEYSERNLETQLYSSGFNSFATGLAREWIADHRLQGAHVLEIGAGGAGGFLRLFCELSGGTGIGLDPAVRPAEDGPVRLFSRPFDSTWREPADAVLCRHTLEHVGDVGAFLGDLARWARANPAAVHLFELPDLSTILERGSFWDLYYEHASYFTADTLCATFERHGFEVLRCRRVFDDQYLVLEARLGRSVRAASANRGKGTLAAAERLARRYEELRPRYARRFLELRADGPVVVWQAGAKAAALLGIPDVAGSVSALVDVNPGKRGRFIVGAGLPVVGPEDLLVLEPAHVVVMNAVYLDEISVTLRERGVDASLHSAEGLVEGDEPARPAAASTRSAARAAHLHR